MQTDATAIPYIVTKMENGLPFWCRLTQVVQEKRPLNECNTEIQEKHRNTPPYTYLHTTFYSSLDCVWDKPGELVSEGKFCHLLDFLVQNEINTSRSFK